MIIRSYSGRTVAEALEKVRAGLGERALIIETRPVKEPGLFGTRCGYEVVAAGEDVDAGADRAAEPTGALPATQASRSTVLSTPDPRPQTPDRGNHLDAELSAIRRQIARLAAGAGTPVGHLGEDLAAHLEDAELPAEHLAELDEAIGRAGERLDPLRRHDFAAAVLARSLPGLAAIDWSATRHLLVVGPTGVGKTTTIAKLAGDLVLHRRRRVALVTIDTYRVGGQDQLKAYADLLDVPLAVAATPAQLAEAMARFADHDHILVDTSGRSPADSARVHELKGFCRAAPGLEVMLAVAANAGRGEFAAVVERFSILPVTHAVITKLDECAAPGRLYGCLRRHRLPVNFITTGQEVPADIVAAQAGVVVERMMTPRTADC